jgi:hypothetical protein
MPNPFVYGEVVPATAFVNRVAELDRLVGDLAAAQKVFLISPRRYGKSSLIRHALATMTRRGALTITVNVSTFSSYVAFLEGYARAIASAKCVGIARATGWSRRFDPPAPKCGTRRTTPLPALWRVVPGVRSDRDASRLAEEIYALPREARHRRADAKWSAPSTSFRRSAGSMAVRLSTRFVPPFSISARSGTSLPAPNQA